MAKKIINVIKSKQPTTVQWSQYLYSFISWITKNFCYEQKNVEKKNKWWKLRNCISLKKGKKLQIAPDLIPLTSKAFIYGDIYGAIYIYIYIYINKKKKKEDLLLLSQFFINWF